MGFLSSEIGVDPVVVKGLFPAPVASVYRAWTDPEAVAKWFGLEAGCVLCAEIDLRVGGRWCFVVGEGEEGRDSLEGRYIAIEPEKRLVFSWRHVRDCPDGRREETPESTVTVTFRAEGAATHLHLSHAGILREAGRLGVGGGWEASFTHLGDWLAG